MKDNKLANKTIRSRTQKESLEGVITAVIGQLRWYFEDSVMAGKFENYLNDRFDKMEKDNSINHKSIVVNFLANNEAIDDEINIAHRRILAAIDVSLYFCFKANNAYDSGDIEKAWFFATEASKWQGIAGGSEHAFLLRRNNARNFAAAGGRGRSDSYEPLRQFSLQAVKEKAYPSRRNAALSIKFAVLELASRLRIPMSEQQAEKTITGWLKDVPFASTRGRIQAGIIR